MEYTSKSILSHYYSRIACSFNTSDAQSAENIMNVTKIRIEIEKAFLMGLFEASLLSTFSDMILRKKQLICERRM